MGQFKPMVKMETTEPSVELKLAKGGTVKMKKGGSTTKAKKMAMGGGAMNAMMGTPALVGRPAVNAPVRAPGKPSMADRRKAMMAKPAITPSGPSMSMPPMKKGGKAMKMAKGGMDCMAEGGKSDMAQDKAMIKKAFKQHDMQEHKGGKGTSLKLKKGGKMATGGVVLGNGGGYKKGGKVKMANGGMAGNGIIPESMSASGSGPYRNTEMHTAERMDKTSGKTGGVKDGNGGGYATGGVVLGNGGGYKKGGKASKKAYATGGTVDSGRPVAMPQGRKPVPSPVAISRLAGTYKNGGRATPAEARLLKNNAAENFASMRDANKNSNLKYGSPKRMAEGGKTEDLSNGAYDKTAQYNRELEDAMNPLSMAKELYGKVRDSKFVKDIGEAASDYGDLWMKGAGLRSQNAPNPRAITKTKESVTVAPAGKKRGGRAC
jgi:hypothetical protein